MFSTLLRYISSSAKGSSTAKSPTLTLSGRTNTPNLGAHVKYRFGLVLPRLGLVWLGLARELGLAS